MNKILLSTILVFGAATALPANAQTAPAPTPEIEYVRGEVVQQVPQSEAPMSGELPICKPKQETNCINSWEANRTGNRPINYWPGRPASEIKEPLPLNDPNG